MPFYPALYGVGKKLSSLFTQHCSERDLKKSIVSAQLIFAYMAKIIITRSGEYANRLRAIKIFADGTLLGTIGNGETKTFDIAPGTYSLQAKIDWCRSNALTVDIGENASRQFYLDSFARHSKLGAFAAIYYITFGASRYLHLAETK